MCLNSYLTTTLKKSKQTTRVSLVFTITIFFFLVQPISNNFLAAPVPYSKANVLHGLESGGQSKSNRRLVTQPSCADRVLMILIIIMIPYSKALNWKKKRNKRALRRYRIKLGALMTNPKLKSKTVHVTENGFARQAKTRRAATAGQCQQSASPRALLRDPTSKSLTDNFIVKIRQFYPPRI